MKLIGTVIALLIMTACNANATTRMDNARWYCNLGYEESCREYRYLLRQQRSGREYEIRRARIIRQEPVSAEKCRPLLAVVGDQYTSEDGAQGEADKAWMQTARWQWGERYMAREHADDVTYECGRSSVGSVAGQVFYRCRLTAKPCRPDETEGK